MKTSGITQNRGHAGGRDYTPLIAVGIFVFTILVFLPLLGGGFVNWDDPSYVYRNIHIRSLDLKWIFTAVVVSNYHPVTLLSHTLDYALFGLNPMGHHLTSLVLHGLNSALFFIIAFFLLEGREGKKEVNERGANLAAALIAALLFAVHPLHVESVAWVSERKDVLSAFFFLISIFFYLSYARERNYKKYFLTLLTFILALLSKPMAITLPVVLLIIDWYPLKREATGWTKLIIEKIPFFALSAASAILTLWAQKAGGGLRGLETHSAATRLYIAARAVVFYPYKVIFPINLSPYYPLPFNTGLLNGAFIVSLIFIILITLLCLVSIKRQRWPAALWAFYLVTLLPVSGLVTVGGQAVADRYAYIPTMGFFILAGTAAGKFFDKNRQKTGAAKAAVTVITLIIITIFTISTIRQAYIWKNSITLMSRAISLYPDRAAIPYNNRGLAYDEKGERSLALSDYNRAIAISPEFTEAYINRGIVYGESSLFEKAIEDFSRALAINGQSAKAYMNRGAAYMSVGDYAGALRDLRRAADLDPSDAVTFYNLGLAYLQAGDRAKALDSMNRAARLGLAGAKEFISREGLR